MLVQCRFQRRRTENSGFILSLNPVGLLKDQRIYHKEYPGHRHHEPAEFVCEGLEGLGLAGDGVHSLPLRIFGFKLRPQLLLIHNTYSIRTYWTNMRLPETAITLRFISHRQCPINKMYVHRLQLGGDQTISTPCGDIADLPLPPPNR